MQAATYVEKKTRIDVVQVNVDSRFWVHCLAARSNFDEDALACKCVKDHKDKTFAKKFRKSSGM